MDEGSNSFHFICFADGIDGSIPTTFWARRSRAQISLSREADAVPYVAKVQLVNIGTSIVL